MSQGLNSVKTHIITVILNSALQMSVLIDGNNPRNGTDSLQIIPATWDTTTNQFVPTTSFSTFFYAPSSPTNSHA